NPVAQVAPVAQEQARKCVEAATSLVEKELQGKIADPWSGLRLVQIGARVGLTEQLQPVVRAIADGPLKSRAQLEILRAQLAGLGQADVEALNQEDKEQAPRPAVVLVRARHCARHGNGAALIKTVAAWEHESLRPFGYVAVALGLQDAGK